MEALVFVINPGSTSKKYGLYSGTELVAQVKIESLGAGQYQAEISSSSSKSEQPLEESIFKTSTQWALAKALDTPELKSQLKAVAIRMVGPGKLFSHHQRVTPELVTKLQQACSQAPLHIQPVLDELEQLQGQLEPDVEIWAISDSAFHQTMPDKAKYYGINLDEAIKYDIMRYGYHGISLSGAVATLETMCDVFPSRVIVCHLGGGASITALKDKQSVDTSMGLTPLEGLLMNTRGGDLDDGALIRLAIESGRDIKQMEAYLYKECGLYGISGQSGDIRQLLELEQKGHARAKLALEMFVYKIQKYIGSYFATLGGLDVLVFTGTIGERSSIIRQRIVDGLYCLGVQIDQQVNQNAYESSAWINPPGSPAGVAIITTNEMSQIASQTLSLINPR